MHMCIYIYITYKQMFFFPYPHHQRISHRELWLHISLLKGTPLESVSCGVDGYFRVSWMQRLLRLPSGILSELLKIGHLWGLYI